MIVNMHSFTGAQPRASPCRSGLLVAQSWTCSMVYTHTGRDQKLRLRISRCPLLRKSRSVANIAPWSTLANTYRHHCPAVPLCYILLVVVSPLGHAASNCHYPNGGLANIYNGYPCDANATVSVCCGANAACLSSGNNLVDGDELVRGACTDQTWLSPSCQGWCKSK